MSRHHFVVEANPPGARIRDFGSLNGMWVNGKKIGNREKGETPVEASGVPAGAVCRGIRGMMGRMGNMGGMDGGGKAGRRSFVPWTPMYPM